MFALHNDRKSEYKKNKLQQNESKADEEANESWEGNLRNSKFQNCFLAKRFVRLLSLETPPVSQWTTIPLLLQHISSSSSFSFFGGLYDHARYRCCWLSLAHVRWAARQFSINMNFLCANLSCCSHVWFPFALPLRLFCARVLCSFQLEQHAFIWDGIQHSNKFA